MKKNKNLIAKVRANKSGCLAGCSSGPTVVIYPNQIWYKNVKINDVPEIINKTIINNEVIDRLLLK